MCFGVLCRMFGGGVRLRQNHLLMSVLKWEIDTNAIALEISGSHMRNAVILLTHR